MTEYNIHLRGKCVGNGDGLVGAIYRILRNQAFRLDLDLDLEYRTFGWRFVHIVRRL